MARKKTKDQPPAKEKPFSTNAFEALKRLTIDEAAKPEPAAQTPKTPAPRQEPEADDLFRQAMTGVRPLDGQPRPKQKKTVTTPSRPRSPVSKSTPALPRDEVIGRKTFLQELDKLKLDVRFEDRLPEDNELRPLSGNRLRQVKRGIIRLDRQLDLHGLTREEALEGLSTFLTSARQAGEKAVLVITGQGLHSVDGPVLQQAVAGWLRDQGRGLVLEYAPAPRELGGNGALLVFLRPLDKPAKD